jgi:hypothetical protein
MATDFTPDLIAKWRKFDWIDGTDEVEAMLDAITNLSIALSAAQLRSIEERNPGIDMERVKATRNNPWDLHQH